MARGNRVIPRFIDNYEHFDRDVKLNSLLKEYAETEMSLP